MENNILYMSKFEKKNNYNKILFNIIYRREILKSIKCENDIKV